MVGYFTIVVVCFLHSINIFNLANKYDEYEVNIPSKKLSPPLFTIQWLEENEEDFTPTNIKNSLENLNIQNNQTPLKDFNAESNFEGKSAEAILNRKKLNILSNNYQPNKTLKKGKLKKPQSQKEPTLNYPRDFAGVNKQSNIYSGGYYADNSGFVQVPSLIPDEKESYMNSQFYNNFERSTTSSGGSNNIIPRWDSYPSGVKTYQQSNTEYWVSQVTMKPKMAGFEKEGCIYPPGYYYQPVQPPSGYEINQGIMTMPQTNIIYTDYMHPPMIPIQNFNGK